jgi:predicted aldo/keto reductase-like oxidoreductase
MSEVNRREFISFAAGLFVAGAAMGVGSIAGVVHPKTTNIRVLGNTGLSCSYLGIGTGTRGSGPGITELTMKLTGEQIVALLEYAYVQGITYFDLADRYGSHNYMRLALQRSVPRDKVMLLSKVWSRDAVAVKSDLERMRQELNVDCIDVVLMHCLREGEENWPETLRPVMDVLEEEKVKGHIKAHGVSCHNLPAFERVPGEPWCDVVLARINPFGVRMDGPVEKVVPVLKKAHEAGKGVLGMKIMGEGDPEVVAKKEESLRFIADLGCVDAMTIGFLSTAQLDEVSAIINKLAAV